MNKECSYRKAPYLILSWCFNLNLLFLFENMIPFADKRIKFIDHHFPLLKRIRLCDDIKLIIATYLLNTPTVVTAFAKHGYVNCFEYIVDECSTMANNSVALMNACNEGHFKIVELIMKTSKHYDRRAYHLACKNGFLEIVKLFIKAGMPYDDTALGLATCHGHYEIICLMRDTYNKKPNRNAVFFARKNGHHKVAKQLEHP